MKETNFQLLKRIASGIKRRIKNAISLLFSDRYILVVGTKGIKDGGYRFDFNMRDAHECKRIGMFIHNYLEATESALDEVNKIINKKP